MTSKRNLRPKIQGAQNVTLLMSAFYCENGEKDAEENQNEFVGEKIALVLKLSSWFQYQNVITNPNLFVSVLVQRWKVGPIAAQILLVARPAG